MPNESPDKGSYPLGRRTNLIFALAISALVALYAAVLIAVPDKLFADDSYFYFQVARNFARGMGSTFNTIMPTNGYHPVWMLLCAGVFKIFPARVPGIHAVACLIVLFQILTLVTVRRILMRVAEDLWFVAFSLLVPFSFLSQLGTEGALSGFCLAMVMLFGYRFTISPTFQMALAFNLAAVFAVLSRLDNIFIVGFVWIAVWIALDRTRNQVGTQPGTRSGRYMQATFLPLYAVMWGGYLASNYFLFGAIQPISGMLKSNSIVDHSLGRNLPHTAQGSLMVIIVCLIVLAFKKRDTFFRVIEVPFALGVLCHGLYILLRMSNETKWSWYYTSWILLSSVLFARVAALIASSRRWLATPAAALCFLFLAVMWFRESYQHFYLGPDVVLPASFNKAVYEQAGIHRAFAYDQPGLIAYYSDVQVVPLDGLMGNLQFQSDLAAKGIRQVALEEKIDGFIGPPSPVHPYEYDHLCKVVYLSTEQFHCLPNGEGGWTVTGVDIYSRVPAMFAGNLSLRDDQIVWTASNLASVWNLGSEFDPSHIPAR